MTSAEVLNFPPNSEAPPGPAGETGPNSIPGWQYCYVHRVPFLYECSLCAGAMLSYGD
ncbi:MAG: hypothetical protein OK442_00545 [Thaumarchaeota archaeon]|nr:hypothetical protein [Nitrososphaerota archaeon]